MNETHRSRVLRHRRAYFGDMSIMWLQAMPFSLTPMNTVNVYTPSLDNGLCHFLHTLERAMNGVLLKGAEIYVSELI